ncbi:hypothetical protein D9758_005365 [Tetrapyrgos nigripes]|uniref:Cytochrome P450 n=1 Tax=Tetrapyrgos nigripes TaxID=182062 RepID=A0A8H5GHP8_9AGAR|nr:hypothetical protein D9758_005365 [Tetrapyrgos nigripes]
MPATTDLAIVLTNSGLLSTPFVSVFSIGFAAFVVHKLVSVRAEENKLGAIPTVGPRGFFGFYVGAFRYLFHAKAMVEHGYRTYPDGAFKIATINGWVVFINGKKMAEEMRKAPDDQLSFTHAVSETLQIEYTLGKDFDLHRSQVVRGGVTKNIANRFDDIRDEIMESLSDEIPVSDEWTKLAPMPAIRNVVTRAANRYYVGLPLCREPEWINVTMNFAVKVFLVVGRLVTPLPSAMKVIIKYFEPMIKERLAKEEECGSKDWPDKPNDLLTWLLDEPPVGEQHTVYDLASRALSVNLAAIHPTSLMLINTLHHLCVNPEVVKALRQEIEETVNEFGWTKAAIDNMEKLDSFLKETQRLSGSNASGVSRKAVKDFVFSNGIVLPAGTMIACPAYSLHHDENNYKNPMDLDPFRFCKVKVESKGVTQQQMVTPHPDYVLFGIGRHACPGRYLAVSLLKGILSHILIAYDVKLEKDEGFPKPQWFQDVCVPDMKAQVLFRRRQD